MRIKSNTKAKNTLCLTHRYTVRVLAQDGEIIFMGGCDDEGGAHIVAMSERDSAIYSDLDPEWTQVIDNHNKAFLLNKIA